MGAELFGRSGLRKWYNEKKMVSSNGWYEAWGMNVCGALSPWYEKVL